MGRGEGEGQARGPLREVLSDPTLRRLQYAMLGSVLGRFGFLVALAVWAFHEGGAALVGIAGFLRIGPGALVAPFASPLVDRHPRQRVMAASDLGRAVLFALAAGAIAAGLPGAVTLVLVALTSMLGTLFEPARAALMPAPVGRPDQLAAANAVASAVNSVAFFAGPALGGVLLAATSPQLVFAVTALALLWSAANVVRLRPRHADAIASAGEPG